MREIAEDVLTWECLYDRGHGVNQNYSYAKKFYEKSCNARDGKGCNGLGFLYDQGWGVNKDYFQAKQFFEKACEFNYAEGCFNLGFLYERGRGGG